MFAKYLSFKLPIIDRYLATELSIFFLFSVGLLSAVSVAVGTLSHLIYQTTEYNIPIPVAVLIFCYQVPEYVAYALPISILLTTLVVYGRLNSNCELIAMRSIGISAYRLILSGLILSLVVTAMTFLLNEFVVPLANYRASVLQNAYIPETELSLARTDIFYPEFNNNQAERSLKNIYYARSFKHNQLHQVTILSWSQGRLQKIITARQARWNSKQRVWELFGVKINFLDSEIGAIATKQLAYTQLKLSPDIFQIVSRDRSPEAMNINQAREYLKLIKNSSRKREIKLFQVRIQQKLAFPFICLVFATVGSALGTNFTQINKAKGFGICIVIVFFYYFLGFIFGALGIVGLVSPFVAAWLPNAIGLAIGIRLTYLANH